MKNINRMLTGLLQVEEILKTKKKWYIWDYYKYSNDPILNIHAKEYFNDKFRDSFWKLVKITLFIGAITIGLICVGIGLILRANADFKITYDNLQIEGMNKPPFWLYSRLKDECYAQDVNDKAHCIKTGLSIAYAESSWKDLDTPFGLQSADKSYRKWVSSYKKYWYKANSGFFFYGDYGRLGPSHYCTSEESSGSSLGCPNGRVNFSRVFHNLTF